MTTLYDLANSAYVQGNISVVIFNDDCEEVRRVNIECADDLSWHLRHELQDMEDLEVMYMYAELIDKTPWFVIELKEGEDDE